VVLFLSRYKQKYRLSERLFLSAFSLAVYDFYDSKREEEKLEELKRIYGIKFLKRLEAIAQEALLLEKESQENSHLTRRLYQECMRGKHEPLMRDLRHYLIVFLREIQEYRNQL